MQPKMLENQMDRQEIDAVLKSSTVGHFATINRSGYPYIIAMHFVYFNGAVYLHGRQEGEKINNLRNNPRVCFEVEEVDKIVTENLPSAANATTKYKSVIILGLADLVADPAEKEAALKAFVEKYTPEFKGKPLPPHTSKITGIIRISIEQVTGKHRK